MGLRRNWEKLNVEEDILGERIKGERIREVAEETVKLAEKDVAAFRVRWKIPTKSASPFMYGRVKALRRIFAKSTRLLWSALLTQLPSHAVKGELLCNIV